MPVPSSGTYLARPFDQLARSLADCHMGIATFPGLLRWQCRSSRLLDKVENHVVDCCAWVVDEFAEEHGYGRWDRSDCRYWPSAALTSVAVLLKVSPVLWVVGFEEHLELNAVGVLEC